MGECLSVKPERIRRMVAGGVTLLLPSLRRSREAAPPRDPGPGCARQSGERGGPGGGGRMQRDTEAGAEASWAGGPGPQAWGSDQRWGAPGARACSCCRQGRG